MKIFSTEKRYNKIKQVVTQRQHSLRVVIENIHDPHNVSAIFRTCDAVGVPKISLIYNDEVFPKISKTSSSSALKWVEKDKFKKVETCFNSLRKEGFKIYSTLVSRDAVNIYDLDLTEKIAIVMGNESRGVSEEAAKLSDKCIYIPMYGMIESLNVSVAAAVILYEIQRQRKLKGMYSASELSPKELEEQIIQWCEK